MRLNLLLAGVKAASWLHSSNSKEICANSRLHLQNRNLNGLQFSLAELSRCDYFDPGLPLELLASLADQPEDFRHPAIWSWLSEFGQKYPPMLQTGNAFVDLILIARNPPEVIIQYLVERQDLIDKQALLKAVQFYQKYWHRLDDPDLMELLATIGRVFSFNLDMISDQTLPPVSRKRKAIEDINTRKKIQRIMQIEPVSATCDLEMTEALPAAHTAEAVLPSSGENYDLLSNRALGRTIADLRPYHQRQ